MKLSHLLEYTGLRLLMLVTRRLSPSTSSRVGERLGDLAFDVMGMRKELVMGHLERVLGRSEDTAALRGTARSVYRQLGRTAVEHARLLTKGITDVRDRLTVSGEEYIEQARSKNRGAILITGHFGYWELLGAAVAGLGHPITVVAKNLHNPAVNRLILEGRERLGMAVTDMDAAPPAILRALRRNECVGLLADQDAGSGRGIRRFSREAGLDLPGAGAVRPAYGRPHLALFHHPVRSGTPPGLVRIPHRG